MLAIEKTSAKTPVAAMDNAVKPVTLMVIKAKIRPCISAGTILCTRVGRGIMISGINRPWQNKVRYINWGSVTQNMGK
jgi:hypothetical protein